VVPPALNLTKANFCLCKFREKIRFKFDIKEQGFALGLPDNKN
jgi:hypothetical protein